MLTQDWMQIHNYILQFEQEGLVTRTFRRLDPERQQAIFDAILDEAVERGPTALNIKQVARRAGVSVGALYTYFENRAAMLSFAVELCSRYITDSFNRFRPYLMALPLQQALRYYVVGGIEWGKTEVSMLRFFARAAYYGDPELAEPLVYPVATVMRDMVQDILAQAAERGEIRADVDLKATTRVIHALTIAIGDSQLLPYLNTYLQVSDQDISDERTLEAMLTLILQGISSA